MEKYNKEWIEQQVNNNKQHIVDLGLKNKYNRYGLYKIEVNGKLVYIGKSRDMLTRVANHMFGIDYDTKSNKYVYLRAARETGYRISFDVLEYTEEDDVKLGQAEAAAIHKYRPVLNKQLPAFDGSNKWKKNMRAWNLTYEQFIKYLDNED